MVVAHISPIMEILPFWKFLPLTGLRPDRPLRVHNHILFILLDELQRKVGLIPLFFLQDVLLRKLGAVEGLIEVVILLYVLFLDLKHVFEHFVVVIIYLFEHFYAFGRAVIVIALGLAHLVAGELRTGLVMMALNVYC